MEGTGEHIATGYQPEPEPKTAGRPKTQRAAANAGAAGKSGASKDANAGAAALESRPPAEVSLRSLLQAGVHFGHQTSRWSPKMAPYIYTSRNGIHIINLPKTVQCWKAARQEIVNIVSNGGSVLFVGTKKQAQESVNTEAKRCGAFYVSRRWLGGMMTNFQTIRKSIERMGKVETILAEEEAAQQSGQPVRYTKKERLMMTRELEKLQFSLGGIRGMYGAPQLMFVIDIKREDLAIKEARKLDIPIVALVDTNCDPTSVTYPIPSNDDGTRAIKLFCQAVSDAVAEGSKIYQERVNRGEFSARDKFVQSSAHSGRRGSNRGSEDRAHQEEAAPVEANGVDAAAADAVGEAAKAE